MKSKLQNKRPNGCFLDSGYSSKVFYNYGGTEYNNKEWEWLKAVCRTEMTTKFEVDSTNDFST